MSTELQASKVGWKKLRKLAVTASIVAGIGVAATYLLWGGVVFLSADGLVTSRSVAIAAPWQDARIREVFVRPGDWVTAGQEIAVVESGTMSRSLADLAGEKARLSSRLAQLEARKTVVATLLPLAEKNSAQAAEFLGALEKAGANGLTVSKTLQEMTNARMQASDHFLSMKAEQSSLDVEIDANRKALDQVSSAYNDLQRTYGDGVLHAPASGLIGSHVAMVGEVLSPGKDKVASIYAGASFVLAYIPETYLLELEKGQRVTVTSRGQSVGGYIEKVLPVTEALPPEFQLPNRVRGRGQLVRIELSEKNNFAIDQKVEVTTCYFDGCRARVSGMVKSVAAGLRNIFNAPVQAAAGRELSPPPATDRSAFHAAS
jgi:multidrug resistance efflux pump